MTLRVSLIISLLCFSTTVARAQQPTSELLSRRFIEVVQPFVKTYCSGCHNAEKHSGKLDLSGHTTIAIVAKNPRVWDSVLERLTAGDMPPETATRQPTAAERKAVIDWLKGFRADEAKRNAGDPGIVPARRLSNAEFDYTVRDLTGVDIRPTREFPVDPANEAGFDNSAESLAMSPALFKKYLAATKLVADHLVLKPHGFVFAPHPAVTETDRDKYCVKRIVDFYERHRVDYADYFLAAWKYQHRAALGKPNATLSDFSVPLSGKYLQTIWSLLNESDAKSGPLAEVLSNWRKFPQDVEKLDEVRRGCEDMRDFVVKSRKQYEPKVDRLKIKGVSDGSQPLVLWRNRQLAAARMKYTGDAEGDERQALELFCRVFPDTFAVSARGAYFDAKLGAEARLLTAGFHLMQGYYRDDGPLYELVLTDDERRELDDLWKELNFITSAPQRQYADYIFFERAEPPRFAGGAEFDFARSEDKDVSSAATIARFREVYLARVTKQNPSNEAMAALEKFFTDINADLRWTEQARLAAEPSHLESLLKFTERAYRRPLSQSERNDLLTFYRVLRAKDGLSHEDAIRDTLVSVLLSPHFCYRMDAASTDAPARPLTDYELASRLSYFLWSSLPDDELLARASAGDLRKPEVLIAQARRMLRDPRVRGLATEFAGNWLEFRRFEEHNGVDRERFPAFTNELRQAMFEEPLRFFIDVASNNRSVLDFLYADHTFVNGTLAKHYGMTEVSRTLNTDGWFRVNNTKQYGRGGLLPMSVFLTQNSPGLRTSPVKRGYWVVRRMLGEHIPPPPPEVPELPKDEAQLGDLTLPQLLAKHRDHKACAGCHQRFDSIGLVFESYGPLGERRDRDLGGKPVDAKATFPDNTTGTGLVGLQTYLSEKRQDEFLNNLCCKLLAYALGRTLLHSDQPLVDNMRNRLAADNYRFGNLIETIVTSPQFLNKRGSSHQAE